MQIVNTSFNDNARRSVRPLSWSLKMSFDKLFDDSIKFFTLNSSLLDGPDLLAVTVDNPIQLWDYYKYLDYTDRVKMIEWSREIEFPNSVSSAMVDFTLNNFDNYFTPNSGSPIDSYIIPKRPLRILSGFNGYNIPQFVGLTEKTPIVDDSSRTVSFHGLDFLSQMYTFPLVETLAMKDVRTDEVLANIFQQFGLEPSQYNLDRARNEIRFVFFDKGAIAGDVFRQLMEAEMGNLWLDEQGIIRFTRRFKIVQSSSYDFNESNTINIKTTGDEKIINKIKILTDLREVQDYQIVYTKVVTSSDLFVVKAGETNTFSADLQDPCVTIVEPIRGINAGVSWFIANLPNGTEVTSGVSILNVELRTNSYIIVFSNSNFYDINISSLELWGQPAKIIDKIEYTEIEQSSIDKYDEHILEINNPFVQSIDQCDSIAIGVLDQFSDYAGEIEIEVKGNPALQLDDIISVNVKTYIDNYEIVKIKNRIQDGKYSQTLTCRRYIPRHWFILDLSLLDGTDVLSP